MAEERDRAIRLPHPAPIGYPHPVIRSALPIAVALLVATVLEVTGDAVVRIGLGQAGATRLAAFTGGAVLLFGYGYALNSAPIDFGRVVGLYIATLFVVWQVIAYATFRAMPGWPTFIGGAFIVAGGLIVTLWPTPSAG